MMHPALNIVILVMVYIFATTPYMFSIQDLNTDLLDLKTRL